MKICYNILWYNHHLLINPIFTGSTLSICWEYYIAFLAKCLQKGNETPRVGQYEKIFWKTSEGCSSKWKDESSPKIKCLGLRALHTNRSNAIMDPLISVGHFEEIFRTSNGCSSKQKGERGPQIECLGLRTIHTSRSNAILDPPSSVGQSEEIFITSKICSSKQNGESWPQIVCLGLRTLHTSRSNASFDPTLSPFHFEL